MGATKRVDTRRNRKRETRDPLLAARVEPSMHTAVKQAAAAAGMTLSDWVRQAVTVGLQNESLLNAEVQN